MRSVSRSRLVYRAIDSARTFDCSEKAQEIRFSIISVTEVIFTDRLCRVRDLAILCVRFNCILARDVKSPILLSLVDLGANSAGAFFLSYFCPLTSNTFLIKHEPVIKIYSRGAIPTTVNGDPVSGVVSRFRVTY